MIAKPPEVKGTIKLIHEDGMEYTQNIDTILYMQTLAEMAKGYVEGWMYVLYDEDPSIILDGWCTIEMPGGEVYKFDINTEWTADFEATPANTDE